MFKAVFLVTFLAFAATCMAANKKIVCYLGSWAAYRNGNGRFEVPDIDPGLCTHLVYTFVGISNNGDVTVLDPWLDLTEGRNGFRKFVELVHSRPGVKAMIAIGGWNEGSIKYSHVVNDPTLRARFVQNVVDFLRQYNFDGFDVDWEYPNQRGGIPLDRENYVVLLRELRQKFDEHGFLLSVAVGAAESSASRSYLISQMSQHVHFINLMTYDFNGSWNKVTGSNAPLYACNGESGEQAKLNVDSAVRYWLSQGAPADKLILGIPFYGRSFTLIDPGNNGLGAPANGPGISGRYTQESGMLGYNEICENFRQGGWTVHRDPNQHTPFAFKDNQWVGYDDVNSINDKGNYINSMGLGGAMVWSIETDDFRGVCGEKYPLLKTLNNVLRVGSSNPDPAPPKPPATEAPPPPPPTPPPSNVECTREGYMRDPNDCSVFYRCEMMNGQFVKHPFKCAAGTFFDPSIKGCNYAALVPGCGKKS